MAQIKNEQAYRAAMARIDALLPLINDETPADDPNFLELDMLSDMVVEYEDIHYPIGAPSLVEVIKLRILIGQWYHMLELVIGSTITTYVILYHFVNIIR